MPLQWNTFNGVAPGDDLQRVLDGMSARDEGWELRFMFLQQPVGPGYGPMFHLVFEREVPAEAPSEEVLPVVCPHCGIDVGTTDVTIAGKEVRFCNGCGQEI